MRLGHFLAWVMRHRAGSAHDMLLCLYWLDDSLAAIDFPVPDLMAALCWSVRASMVIVSTSKVCQLTVHHN